MGFTVEDRHLIKR